LILSRLLLKIFEGLKQAGRLGIMNIEGGESRVSGLTVRRQPYYRGDYAVSRN
jgi:hypothetical protein